MKHEIDADTNCNWCAFWKTPGHDGINGYWLSKFTSIHHRLAVEMNTCLQETDIPERMTKEKTTLNKNNN